MRVDCFLMCFIFLFCEFMFRDGLSGRISMGLDKGPILLECVFVCFCWIPQAHYQTRVTITSILQQEFDSEPV